MALSLHLAGGAMAIKYDYCASREQKSFASPPKTNCSAENAVTTYLLYTWCIHGLLFKRDIANTDWRIRFAREFARIWSAHSFLPVEDFAWKVHHNWICNKSDCWFYCWTYQSASKTWFLLIFSIFSCRLKLLWFSSTFMVNPITTLFFIVFYCDGEILFYTYFQT